MKELNIAECEFAADIVPYMYGELPASETFVFESHLPDCEKCTDEFAMISSARYEVYDWKKLEFDPLPTPRFVIPSDEPAVAFSWFDKIRTAFASSWAIPAVGFASLAVIAVFAASIMVSDDRGVEVVSNGSNTNVKSPAVVASAVSNPPVVDKKDEQPATGFDRAVVVTSGKKVDNHSASPSRTGQRPASRDTRPPRMIEARTTTVQKQGEKVPTLNEFGDDEDNSLRLAELFEDIETSD